MTNMQKRRVLLEELKLLEKQYDADRLKIIDNYNISDDECDKMLIDLHEEHKAKYWPIWWNAFALQFPKRQGWFADTFVKSFDICESKRISAKQANIFAKYCISDDDTWKTGKYYCRANDKLIIFSRPKYGNCAYITIIQL